MSSFSMFLLSTMFLCSELVEALETAISNVRANIGISPAEAHSRVRDYYRWDEVAERTEMVCFATDPCMCAYSHGCSMVLTLLRALLMKCISYCRQPEESLTMCSACQLPTLSPCSTVANSQTFQWMVYSCTGMT